MPNGAGAGGESETSQIKSPNNGTGDSGPVNLASLRLQSSPWGCPDDLSDPNTARARPHGRPKGDGESSEGGRYRIWLLLGLVARRRRGDHSSIGEGEKQIKRKVPSGETHWTTEKGERDRTGPHRGRTGPYRGK